MLIPIKEAGKLWIMEGTEGGLSDPLHTFVSANVLSFWPIFESKNAIFFFYSKTIFETIALIYQFSKFGIAKTCPEETNERTMNVAFSVTRKKSPNVYKSCPKMISLEK